MSTGMIIFFFLPENTQDVSGTTFLYEKDKRKEGSQTFDQQTQDQQYVGNE